MTGNREIPTAEFRIDRNPLSSSGPYGPRPILSLVVGGFGEGLVATLVWTGRRTRSP